jgi:DNA modification methylase
MNSLHNQELLLQRADYTHKYNVKSGRHGWLRLTPAYSVRVVEELMAHATRRLRVLDPFCGTATSALSAAYHGHHATTTDINPFLVWLGKAKTDYYSDRLISSTLNVANQVQRVVSDVRSEPQPAPPIYNIERWWSPRTLDFLCRLRDSINLEADPSSQEATLLKVAYCRTLIALSNAAFNHQSMSFKSATRASPDIAIDCQSQFGSDLQFVLKGAHENFDGSARVALHDARALSNLEAEPFDFVVTSPPYANRMSYIRELRPYMYWLHFLMNGRDAGEMDWLAIGGTWGVATSRLAGWQAEDNAYSTPDLERTLTKVSSTENQNGVLLATYIRKYCADMALHFRELRSVLKSGAELHYIVGNSTFYGELLSIEKIYAHMLEKLGFSNINIRAIRKRNSKKELIEFDVSAVWPG